MRVITRTNSASLWLAGQNHLNGVKRFLELFHATQQDNIRGVSLSGVEDKLEQIRSSAKPKRLSVWLEERFD